MRIELDIEIVTAIFLPNGSDLVLVGEVGCGVVFLQSDVYLSCNTRVEFGLMSPAIRAGGKQTPSITLVSFQFVDNFPSIN